MDTISTKNYNIGVRDHRSHSKLEIFIDYNNTIDNLLTNWFNDNNIYSFKWKCKAWNWLSKKRNKLFISRIKKILNLDSSIKVRFSQYAGCSMCPCSPGFLARGPHGTIRSVKIDNEPYNRIWINMDTENETNTFREHIKVADKMLGKELLEHGATTDFDMINTMTKLV
jgi:hypothetical protein